MTRVWVPELNPVIKWVETGVIAIYCFCSWIIGYVRPRFLCMILPRIPTNENPSPSSDHSSQFPYMREILGPSETCPTISYLYKLILFNRECNEYADDELRTQCHALADPPLCNKQASHPTLSTPTLSIQSNPPINPPVSCCSSQVPWTHPVQQIHYTLSQELAISQ
jgi:hypothetical protein